MNSLSTTTARRRWLPWALSGVLVFAAGGVALWSLAQHTQADSGPATTAASSGGKANTSPRPALTVTLIQPTREDWPRTLEELEELHLRAR